MSSGVTLSAAIRSNLLSLQDTASLLSTTQTRLSTGKKVNSAIDNPTNFFTAQNLNSRSSALSTLLDGISNGIQTIQAANQGLTSIQKLTAQLKSTAQQALSSSNAFTTKDAVTTAGTVSVSADGKLLGGASTAATTTGSVAFSGGTLTGFNLQALSSKTSAVDLGLTTAVPTKTSATYSGAGILAQTAASKTSTAAVTDASLGASGAQDGKTLTLDDGNGHVVSFTGGTGQTRSALNSALSAQGYTATYDGTTNYLTITRADGQNFTAGGNTTEFGLTTTATSNGRTEAASDALTLTVGGTTHTFKAVATGQNASSGTFSDLNGLVSAINADASYGNASATPAAGKIHATNVGGQLVITGGDEATSFDFGGSAATKLFTAPGSAATTLQGYAGQTIALNDSNGNVVNFAITKTTKQSDLTTALASSGYTASIDTSTHFLKVSRADGQNFTSSGPLLASGATTNGVTAAAADKFSLTVGGTTVNLKAVATTPLGAGEFTSLTDLRDAINASSVGSASLAAGKVTASIVSNKLVLTAGDTSTSFTAGGAGATKLGVAATETKPLQTALTGTLNVTVGTGLAHLVTFGAGGIQTLDQLNADLDAYGAKAAIGSDNKLSITTTNEFGAKDIKISGSIAQDLFGAVNSTAEVLGTGLTLGGDGKTTRDKLVSDFNSLRSQIDQLATDAGYNGVNLLAGDNVKVIFNEKNTSSIQVKGVATDSTSLGLDTLTSADFEDATAINKILAKITAANSTLGSQAATFGTSLSVVQNRQDFSKNLINILDTGASNLTSADLNEEAANSTALTTRQSLSISALSLASQAQQGILQLLR